MNAPTKTKYDYHKDYSRISNSMLREFLPVSEEMEECPKTGEIKPVYNKRHYQATYITQTVEPRKPTKEMQEGSILHAIVLERKPIEEVCLVYPKECLKSNGAINPKPCEKYREDNPEFEYFTKAKDFDRLSAALAAFNATKLAELIKAPNAIIEKSFFWKCPETGLDCRMKADLMIPHEQTKTLYVRDLKCTANVGMKFQKHVGNMKWWLQSCSYPNGMAQQPEYEGWTVDFGWIALEPTPPFRVSSHTLHVDAQADAYAKYTEAMQELAYCYETGDWSEPWESETQEMILKPWELLG